MTSSDLVANTVVSKSRRRIQRVAGSAEGRGYQLFQNSAAQSQNEVGLDMKTGFQGDVVIAASAGFAASHSWGVDFPSRPVPAQSCC